MCQHTGTTVWSKPASVPLARRWITEVLRGWQLAVLVDDAQVVVSELVSNALPHAATSVDVTASFAEGMVEVSVADHSPDSPRRVRRRPPHTSTGGRGLLLIERLCYDWGVASRPTGKQVWALLRPPAGTGACPCPAADPSTALRVASGRLVTHQMDDTTPGNERTAGLSADNRTQPAE